MENGSSPKEPSTLNEMCKRFGVTPRTLRYYEEIELLSPERRGRSRVYGPRERARLTLILRGRRFGFSLEEIRQWLLMYQEKGTRAQLQSFVTTADLRVADLIKEQQALAAVIDDLRAVRDQAAADLQGLADQPAKARVRTP
jgi:DNA-binding transcriptional MerR regulator